jgi:signal recognition particle subunit SEC65
MLDSLDLDGLFFSLFLVLLFLALALARWQIKILRNQLSIQNDRLHRLGQVLEELGYCYFHTHEVAFPDFPNACLPNQPEYRWRSGHDPLLWSDPAFTSLPFNMLALPYVNYGFRTPPAWESPECRDHRISLIRRHLPSSRGTGLAPDPYLTPAF